ncbi:MAG: ribulose-phosphate 3-epimerase [Bryobacteraceae bacterium]
MSWSLVPGGRLLADVSLWSADLANLQRDVERMSPYADSFHIDVADGHFVSDLLFFPDLVAALRAHTNRPFHVHLIVDQPCRFVERFASAGADLITVHCELEDVEVRRSIARIRDCGKAAGIAVRLESPISMAEAYLDSVDSILLLGTESGVKGRDLAPEATLRISAASQLLRMRSIRERVLIIADGGIRTHTVPRLRAAGADAIVPGSLVFQAASLPEVFHWVHSIDFEHP